MAYVHTFPPYSGEDSEENYSNILFDGYIQVWNPENLPVNVALHASSEKMQMHQLWEMGRSRVQRLAAYP